MDFEKTKNDLKKGFDQKWKETNMKLNLDIQPEDLLTFDKMIALPAIKVMYWVGLICIALLGLTIIFDGSIGGFFGGIAVMVVGVVIWRITCEAAILLFGIYDRLGEIRNALVKSEPRPSSIIPLKMTSAPKPAVKTVKPVKPAPKKKPVKK